jgi:hypothetical protein
MQKTLAKRIKKYSPNMSEDNERYKLENLGIQFNKCDSCGEQYPEQRINVFCDQCEE